jgi:hypothetical protein
MFKIKVLRLEGGKKTPRALDHTTRMREDVEGVKSQKVT